MRPRVVRWLATFVTLIAICLTLARLASATAATWEGGLRPTTLYYFLLSLGSVMAAALSLAIVRVAWGVSGVGYLVSFLSLFALAAAYEGVVPGLLGRLPISPRGAFRIQALGINAVVVAATASGVRWLQHYPTPLQPPQIRDWARDSGRFASLVGLWLRAMADNRRVWLVFGVLPFVAMSSPIAGVGIEPTTTWMLFLVLGMGTAIGHQAVVRRVSADVVHVRRATWALEALLAGGAVLLLAVLLEIRVHILETDALSVLWLHAVMLPMAMVVFLTSASVSVFLRGAVDPSLVIQRATILGAAGLALTVLFLAAEELLSNLVVTWFGLPDILGGVLAGLFAAAVFTPLYRWAKRFAKDEAGHGTT